LSLKIQNFQKEIEEEIMINHHGVSGTGDGVSVTSLEDIQELTGSEISRYLTSNEHDDVPTEIEKLLLESENAVESGESLIEEFEKRGIPSEEESSAVDVTTDEIPEESDGDIAVEPENEEVVSEN
jgi:hypothetical protein